MMNRYQQLTCEERYVIYALLREGFLKSEISRHLNRSLSTISREINRNSGKRGYRPKQANEKALERRSTSHKSIKFNSDIRCLVEEFLMEDWSPEQISNYLRLEYDISVSTERIYQHVKTNRAHGGTLYKHLRQSNRKRRKKYTGKTSTRGELKNRVSIDNRPEIVERKTRIGDWEIDTIIGKNHKGALLSIVERKSRYTIIDYLPTRHSENVKISAINSLSPYKKFIHTITGDNGKEFACHEDLSNVLDADFYFAHPYCSWERGLNENTNGLIRQYFPKGTSFEGITKKKLKCVMEKLNSRPRKCLDYKTPAQIFENFFLP